MCSINHDLKCIYFHVPKVGGLYVSEILEKVYDFKTYFFTAENNYDYIENPNEQVDNYKGFFEIRKKGMYRYYYNSKKFNKLAGMDENKWKTYFKFTFVRNPFDRCISAYKYLNLYQIKNMTLQDVLTKPNELNNYEYFHFFIQQWDQLVDNDLNINFDFIGKFENLNEDLIKVLNILGIQQISHGYFIENNIVINSSNYNGMALSLTNTNLLARLNYSVNEMIDGEVIEFMNNMLEKDYKTFGYDPVTIDNFNLIISSKKNNIINKNKELLKTYNIKSNCNNLDLNKISIINNFIEDNTIIFNDIN